MKKTQILTALSVVFLLIFMAGCTKEESKSYKSITETEAMKYMADGKDYIILDVRTVEEYQEGHIPNAINIPLDDIEGQPQELPNKEQVILVYCRSGNRSKRASEKLVDIGYTNVIEIGGINAWPGEIEK